MASIGLRRAQAAPPQQSAWTHDEHEEQYGEHDRFAIARADVPDGEHLREPDHQTTDKRAWYRTHAAEDDHREPLELDGRPHLRAHRVEVYREEDPRHRAERGCDEKRLR